MVSYKRSKIPPASARLLLQAAEFGGAVKLVSSCGPSVGNSSFDGNNASAGGAMFVGGYGSNGTCSDGVACQCPPASGSVLTSVSPDAGARPASIVMTGSALCGPEACRSRPDHAPNAD